MPVCEAGRQVSCACPGGEEGAQRCAEDGSTWRECDCPRGAAGGSGGAGSCETLRQPLVGASVSLVLLIDTSESMGDMRWDLGEEFLEQRNRELRWLVA